MSDPKNEMKLGTLISQSSICVTLAGAEVDKAFESTKTGQSRWYQTINFMGGQFMVEVTKESALGARRYDLVVLSASIRQGEVSAKHIVHAQ